MGLNEIDPGRGKLKGKQEKRKVWVHALYIRDGRRRGWLGKTLPTNENGFFLWLFDERNESRMAPRTV